jgi:hypothetical protein
LPSETGGSGSLVCGGGGGGDGVWEEAVGVAGFCEREARERMVVLVVWTAFEFGT